MRRTSRAGFGMLIAFALLVVALLSISSVSLGQLGSAVTGDVRAGQEAARARLVAQAAVEELSFELAVRANDPNSPLFTSLRTDILKSKGGPLDLPLPDAAGLLPAFHARIAPGSPGVKLVGVGARVMQWRSFATTLLPFHAERYGVLALSARVAVELKGVVRTEVLAEKWLDFKVLRTTLPYPFDTMRFCMVEPVGWANAYAAASGEGREGDVNALVRQCLDDPDLGVTPIGPRLARAARDWGAEVARMAKAGIAVPLVEQIAAGVQKADAEVRARLAAAALVTKWWTTGPPPAPLRYFQFPQLRYITKGDLVLDDFNLPALFKQLTPKRAKAVARARELLASLPPLPLSLPSGPLAGATAEGLVATMVGGPEKARRLATDLAPAVAEAVTAQLSVLAEVRRVQESFVRRAGKGQVENAFGPHLALLRTTGGDTFSPGDSGYRVSAGRVTHVVGGPEAAAELTRLLEAEGRHLHGVVEVRNEQSLDLSAATFPLLSGFEGSLTLVVQGDARVHELPVKGGKRTGGGSLALIVHGKTTVSGDVDASIVAMGGFEPSGPTRLRGNLVLFDSGQEGAFTRVSNPERVLEKVRVITDPDLIGPGVRGHGAEFRVLFGPTPIREATARGAPQQVVAP